MQSDNPIEKRDYQFRGRGLIVPKKHTLLNSQSVRSSNIAQYSESLKNSPANETGFVSYYEWHEDHRDFTIGKGVLQCISYHELNVFWNNPDIFVPYEFLMYQFRRRGFEIRRMFTLCAGQLMDHQGRELFKKIVLRHMILGFAPRFITHADQLRFSSSVGVECDALGLINGTVCMMTKFDHSNDMGEPSALRTTNSEFCLRVGNGLARCWSSGRDVDLLWSSFDPPSTEIKEEAEREADFVRIWGEL